MIRYSCNVSTLFAELPFIERFEAAMQSGFGAVEFWSPFDQGCDLAELQGAIESAGVDVVQYNFCDGNMDGGERGYLSHPHRQQAWREGLEMALDLAKQLRPRQLHSLVGNVVSGLDRETQLACLEENLRWALPQLERANLPLMLEALNRRDNPLYLLPYSWDILEVLERLPSPWLRYQCDIYHLQRSQGNLAETIRGHVAQIGHVQIADCPGRHQPGTGEINYRFVLGALHEAGYAGYVGLEYGPLGGTARSLDWLPPSNRRYYSMENICL